MTTKLILPLLTLSITLTACSRQDAPADDPPEVIVTFPDMRTSDPSDMSSPEDMKTAPVEDMRQEPDMRRPAEPDMRAPEPDMRPDLRAPDVCDELGFPRADLITASSPETAAPFTVTTSRGPWSLEEHWTGCDSYIFVNHFESDYGDQLWASDVSALFENAPKNAHFFFGAYRPDTNLFNPNDTLTGRIDKKLADALAALPPEDRRHWEHRVHVITESVYDMQNSVGEFLRGRGNEVVFAVGIDRSQAFDSAGSMFAVGFSGFTGSIPMVGFVPHYYNFVIAQDAELAAQQDVTIVDLFDGQEISQNNDLHDVTFPDAETMAGFNTMEIDVQAACGPTPQDCGEWDYEAYLQLCEDDTCQTSHEITLWITPYSRPGSRRWVADATPFLPLVRDGGARKIRFGMRWNMNKNVMNVSFRLRHIDGNPNPVQTIPLFTELGGGDNFNAEYNDRFAPVTVTPPADITRAEIAVLLTGHGQTQGNNCAEWCNHTHTWSVGGDDFTKSHEGQAGARDYCAKLAREGVVPGQWGNWAPGRAAWCPGQIVQPWRQDITSSITPGEESTISYNAAFNSNAPAGGRIRMSSYLVYYR